MKKVIYAIIICLLATGCVNENPKGQIEESYTSATDVEHNLVATLYNYIGGNAESQGLMGTPRGVYDFNSLTTDEQIIPVRGGDWYDGGFWQRLYYHSWTASESPLQNTWDYLYKVVMLCNRSLYFIDANRNVLTTDEYKRFSAEVRAIRAMFYFYLMDMYGRVPLVTAYDIPLAKVKQNERSEVFKFCMSEFNDVLPFLSEENSNYEGLHYGRLTKPVVWFLMAKLYLNAEVYLDDVWTDAVHPSGSLMQFDVDGEQLNAWQATVVYCDKITACGYELERNAARNFAIHNETSKENIFTIPMNKILYANQFWYLFRSRHYAHGSALGLDAENGASATLSTVNAFGYGTKQVDSRFALSFYADTVKVNGKVVCLDDGKPLVYHPFEISSVTTGSPYEQTAGARMKKYEADATAYEAGKLQDNDIVLYRYADVLLMKAEALVRDGKDGSPYLNQVRSRANMPLCECTLENILRERLLELVWEGWRRNDLVRYGLFHKLSEEQQNVVDETDAHTIVFPIPATTLDLNKQLTQNKGYDIG